MKTTGVLRKTHSPSFKAKVALEASKGDRPVQELCSQYGLVSCQIYDWKNKLENEARALFERGAKSKKTDTDADEKIRKLYETIGKLKAENDFLAEFLNKAR